MGKAKHGLRLLCLSVSNATVLLKANAYSIPSTFLPPFEQLFIFVALLNEEDISVFKFLQSLFEVECCINKYFLKVQLE